MDKAEKQMLVDSLDALHHRAWETAQELKAVPEEKDPKVIKMKTDALADKIKDSDSLTFTEDEAELLNDSFKAIYELYENNIKKNSLSGLVNNPQLNHIREATKELKSKVEQLTENN